MAKEKPKKKSINDLFAEDYAKYKKMLPELENKCRVLTTQRNAILEEYKFVARFVAHYEERIKNADKDIKVPESRKG